MWKIVKFSFSDQFRGRWSQLYFAFYLIITGGLFYLSADASKVIITLMNIILVLNPLISTIFSITYHYNSREFTELLLAQPVTRKNIFLGQYLGLSTALSLSFALGVTLPFALSGFYSWSDFVSFFLILITGICLTFVFSAFAFWIGLKFNNRIKGFGMTILFWLFMAVLYDGVVLLLILRYSDYPLESFALISTLLNPIDLSRIIILLNLDISALMGYTGAVFNKFFSSGLGMTIALMALLIWIVLPLFGMLRLSSKKDF